MHFIKVVFYYLKAVLLLVRLRLLQICYRCNRLDEFYSHKSKNFMRIFDDFFDFRQ